MTESIPARQPKGIPTGGQFAAASHAEPDVALAEPRRPELEGWPEGLPEPEVSLHLNEDGAITTQVKVAGELAFEAWTDEDDPGCAESSGWVNEAIPDDDTREQAEAWVRGKHIEMAGQMRQELKSAFERARASIVAAATGKPEPMGQEELEAYLSAHTDARSSSARDLELASASLAARKILAEHPEAQYAEILTDSWDNGEFVSAARVLDADRNELHTYEDYNEFDGTEPQDQWPVIELVGNLNPSASESHWAGAFSVGSYGEDLYALDLHKAAAWTPGAQP